MNQLATVEQKGGLDAETLQALVMSGDMSKLDPAKRIEYYRARCEAAGLDPRTAPFQYMTLQGKMTLYATKGATDQLARNHKIRLHVVSQETAGDIRVVMVRATTEDGRETDEMGAVPVGNLKGADLANAYMKAITKAKRRAVLSLCGLGMLDETELETVKGVTPLASEPIPMPTAVGPVPEKEIEVDVVEDSNGDGQEPEYDIRNIAFQRIIAEKDDNAPLGKVYHACPVDGTVGILSTYDRVVALKIKNSIEEKKSVRVTLQKNQIVSAEDVQPVS